MSFASDVKNEICRAELEDICCVRAELAGIICFSAQITDRLIKINTENARVAERISELGVHLYKLGVEIEARESGIYSVKISGADVLKILRDMRLATVPIRIDKEISRRECCKRSFVRGAFLGGGSICAPQKGYHMEFVTSHYALCRDFSSVLEYFGITPKIAERKSNYVFYIKDSEQISDLLAVVGAHNKMMEFLNIKIEKEIRNETNRRVNCENANSEKCAGAAVAQTHAILLIKQKLGLENLPPRLESIARVRLELPEATLTDLARELGITKSGANHRMRRLIKIANEIK
ncbi:MAG: Sporulation transcription regulator WhiA [Firmicutes bacterium ADurb.Bin193]|nr:MAG: Sporulation transcription regulator WhiA [Firmicutes bacterium ADurb.Bin193]